MPDTQSTPKVIKIDTDANKDLYGDFTKHAAEAKCEIFNYLDKIAGSARFTEELINTTHRYRGFEESKYSKAKEDNDSPEYVITFIDDNKLNTNTWFLKTVLKNILIDEKDGVSFGDFIRDKKQLPVNFTVKAVEPRCYADTNTVITSQNCWNFKKLKMKIGEKALVFRNMSGSTQAQKADAYSELTALEYKDYIKDEYLTGDALSVEAKRKFVVCSLIITVNNVIDIPTAK